MFWPTSFGIKNPATVWSRWAKYLSIYTGHNLVPYFQWWKWPILQETIDEVKHLPVWKMSEYLKDETRKSCSRHKIQTNDKSIANFFVFSVLQKWFEDQMSKACSVDYCTTNSEDLTESKCSRCSFPFTYKGKVYNECTSDKSPGGLEKPWCATLVKKPGEDPASWGYCHDNCFK